MGSVLIWILAPYLFLICTPAREAWNHGLIGCKWSLGVIAKTGVVDRPFSKLVEIGRATNKIDDVLLVARHGSGLQQRDFARKEHIAVLSRWPAIFSTGRQFFSNSAISLHGLVHFFCGGYISATGKNGVQGRGEAEIFNGKTYIPTLGFLSRSWSAVNSNPRSLTNDKGLTGGVGGPPHFRQLATSNTGV